MNKASIYYQALNEIRKSKNVSIADICEGIISERSFYRLMKSDAKIRMETFVKLANKLDVSPYEVITFATFVAKGDPQLSRFVFRVHTNHYDDIGRIYDEVRFKKVDNTPLSLYITMNILKYEKSINAIDSETYQVKMASLYDCCISEKYNSLYTSAVEVEYLSNQEQVDFTKLYFNINQIIQMDFKISVFFYIMILDNCISYLINIEDMDRTIYKKAIKRYEEVIQSFPNKYFHTNFLFFIAFDKLLENNDFTIDLYKHLLGIIRDRDGNRLKYELERIEHLFKVDYRQILIQNTLKELQGQQFILIE